jgi:hypothetical protein
MNTYKEKIDKQRYAGYIKLCWNMFVMMRYS